MHCVCHLLTMRKETFDGVAFITGKVHVNPPEYLSANGAILYIDLTAKIIN
jgi:hypothetical protein